MRTSQAGIDLIKSFEGCKLRAYQDSVGVWTIGVGHTRGVRQNDSCTQDEADELLHGDLLTAEEDIARLVKVPLTDNEHAALVSWVFNLGSANLFGSTLLKKLNKMDYAGAAAEFPRWNRAGGQVLAGLTRRRLAEKQLFERGFV